MAKAAKKPAPTSGKPTSGKSASNKPANRPAKDVAYSGARTDEMSVARKISWFALLAMIFIVPLAMSNWTWMGFKLPLSYDQFDITKVFFQRVLGCIALGAWGWDMLTRGGKIRRTPVDWLILAFLGWVAISAVLSVSPATAFWGKYRRFEGLLSFINYAVVYFLVLQYADRPSRVRTIAETFFWSGTLVAGYGFLQSIGADPIDWHTLPFEKFRPFSTYGNPDLLGGFLMFSLCISFALALAEEHKWVRFVYWAGFGLNAYVWIVAFTRGAWIGGAVGILLLIVVAWRHSTKLDAIDWLPVGLTTAFGGYAIFKSLSNPNEVLNFASRFASIFKVNEGSGLTRTEIWQAAWHAITYSPLRFIFGWGADTFRLVFPKFKPIEYTRDAGFLSVADNVHDYPLQLAAGIGVVGVILLYGVFVWAAARSAKLVFGKSEDRNRLLVGGFWVASAAYLVQLMFGLSVTGNTFLLWMCIGVVLAPGATFVEVKKKEWGIAAATVLVVLAVGGVAYQCVLMEADYQYLLSNVALNGAERTAAAKLAVKLNPFNDMYRAEIGMAYRQELVDAAQAAVQAQQSGKDPSPYTSIMKEKFDASIAALKDTIDFVPMEYDNYVFIVSVYNIGGSMLDRAYYEDAITWGKKGIEVEPFGPAIRVEYTRALLATNKVDEAIKELETAWGMDHANVDAGTMLAQQYKDKGRISDAIDVLKKTQAAKPTDTSITTLLQQLEASSSASPTPATTP